MSTLFKVTITQRWFRNVWLDAEGNPCAEGTPGARFVERRRVKPGTPGAKKVSRKSTKWYARLPGNPRPVPLSANKVAAQQMLAALLKKHELGTVGISDPFELHRKRPLAEHLDDFCRDLLARDDNPRYVKLVDSRLTAILAGCEFRFAADLSASRAMDWLAELRRKGHSRAPLPEGKGLFTMMETAKMLGITLPSVSEALRRHRVEVIIQKKRRLLPRAAVEA
jgi:hypothetical protein